MIKIVTLSNTDGSINQSFAKISDTDPNNSDLMTLWSEYSFFVPGARFMPAFQRGTFDGYIRLINLSKKTVPIGLIPKILTYCEDASIEIESNVIFPIQNVQTDDLDRFFSQYEYWSKGKQIYPRDDQKKAVYRAIQSGRSINICPTSFGKSLCIYMQCLYNISKSYKTLIIVPTVALVEQMRNDFLDYSNNDIEKRIYTISAGVDKEIPESKDIIISTWQSIYKLNPDWYKQFDWIIGDEIHRAKQNFLSGIFNNATSVAYRTGWTGSLEKSSVNELLCESIIGPASKITDTSTLMDQGIVARLTINMIEFKYPPAIIEACGTWTYADEIKFLEEYKERTDMVCKLASMTPKTGLIVFRKIGHGDEIYKFLRKNNPDRPIYKIHGNTWIRNDIGYKSLEEIKPMIEDEPNAILCCGLQYFSTGISIKNINWIMFAIPFKSFVQTVQTIGRGLRISETKTKLRLFDIIDNLNKMTKDGTKIRKQCYSYKHALERYGIYLKEHFNIDKTLTFRV